MHVFPVHWYNFQINITFFNLLLMKLFMNTLKQFILFTTRIFVNCREMILSLHFSHVNKYKTYIYIYSSFAYIHVTTTSFPCILLEFLTWIKIFKSSSKINWWIIPMHKYSILYIKIKNNMFILNRIYIYTCSTVPLKGHGHDFFLPKSFIYSILHL